MIVSRYGFTEIVRILVEHGGIDINAKDKGRTEIVEILVEQEGIDKNASNYQIL